MLMKKMRRIIRRRSRCPPPRVVVVRIFENNPEVRKDRSSRNTKNG
jgi:hypothetical protein